MLKPVSTVSTSSGTADTKYTEAGSWTKFLSINVCICWSISYLHAYGNHRNNLIVSSIRFFFVHMVFLTFQYFPHICKRFLPIVLFMIQTDHLDCKNILLNVVLQKQLLPCLLLLNKEDFFPSLTLPEHLISWSHELKEINLQDDMQCGWINKLVYPKYWQFSFLLSLF